MKSAISKKSPLNVEVVRHHRQAGRADRGAERQPAAAASVAGAAAGPVASPASARLLAARPGRRRRGRRRRGGAAVARPVGDELQAAEVDAGLRRRGRRSGRSGSPRRRRSGTALPSTISAVVGLVVCPWPRGGDRELLLLGDARLGVATSSSSFASSARFGEMSQEPQGAERRPSRGRPSRIVRSLDFIARHPRDEVRRVAGLLGLLGGRLGRLLLLRRPRRRSAGRRRRSPRARRAAPVAGTGGRGVVEGGDDLELAMKSRVRQSALAARRCRRLRVLAASSGSLGAR